MQLNAVRPIETCHDCRQVMGLGEDEEEEDVGMRVPVKMKDPIMPSEDEIEEHNLTHLPYRSWCVHCVRGRGEATPHRMMERDEDAVPELHLDYCFLGKKHEEAQPVLVARDRDTRMTLSFLVRSKGVSDDLACNRILAFLKEIGRTGKLIIKSDQESSIKVLAEKIAEARGVQSIQEH